MIVRFLICMCLMFLFSFFLMYDRCLKIKCEGIIDNIFLFICVFTQVSILVVLLTRL